MNSNHEGEASKSDSTTDKKKNPVSNPYNQDNKSGHSIRSRGRITTRKN